MADNDENKCPLCGRQINGMGEFCEDCREIADTSYPEELLARSEQEEVIEEANIPEENLCQEDQSEEESQPQPESIHPPKKKNKKLLIFLFVGLILLVLVGGVGSYVFLQNREAKETEIAYWEKCMDENTPLAYSKYLVQYPEGKFSSQAHTNILELREKERKEWDKLRKSRNIEALFTFLKDHPDTPYGREIRYSIDSLSWMATIKANTKEAYQAYIDNVKLGHYSGEHIDLAQQKYDYLSQLKTLEGEELGAVGKVLSDFFKALSSVDSKDIRKYTDTVLIRFYSSNNQKNESIADSIKSSLKGSKIKSISYVPVVDSLAVIKDNKETYFATIPIKTETTFTDRKKRKESHSYKLSIELNKDRLIQSIEKK